MKLTAEAVVKISATMARICTWCRGGVRPARQEGTTLKHRAAIPGNGKTLENLRDESWVFLAEESQERQLMDP